MDHPCLPGLPPPEYGESFNGYLLRVSELNGYDNLALLHKIAGYVGMPLAFRPGNIAPIAQLIDMSQGEVLRMTYETGSSVTARKKLSFLGHDIFHYLADTKHPKICPACVRETRYLQAFWDLTLVVACPIHGQMLLVQCPRCGQPLSWRRRGPLTCSCGANLGTATTPSVGRELRSLMAIIAAAAGLGPFPDQLPSKMPRDLLKMQLGELLHCIAWLGWWNSGRAQETLRRFRMLSPGERAPIVEASLAVLSDWPLKFENFLDRMRGQAPRSSLNPVAREYGKLYAFLFYGAVPPGREFIREAALQWLRSTPDGARLAPSAAKPQAPRLATPERVAYRHLVALGKQIGMGPKAVNRTILGGGLKPLQRTAQVPATDVARLGKRTEDLVLYRDAARLLGVPHKLFRELLHDHAIPCDDSICTDARRTYGSIHRQDLDTYLSSIDKVARQRKRVAGSRFLVSLSDAFQTETNRVFTRKSLLDAVIDGRVRCYRDGKPIALNRLIVDLRDVRAAATEAITGNDADLVLLADAAKEFAVCNETIRKLVRSGRVRGRLIDLGARKYWLISRSDLNNCWRQRAIQTSRAVH